MPRRKRVEGFEGVGQEDLASEVYQIEHEGEVIEGLIFQEEEKPEIANGGSPVLITEVQETESKLSKDVICEKPKKPIRRSPRNIPRFLR